MAKLAVVILTKNEEANIADAMQSASFADEIIVIDSGSTDKTIDIAKEHGGKVLVHSMDDTGFAGQRNFALKHIATEWVLYLDADERITPGLAKEIRQHIAKEPQQAGVFKRINVVMGQEMHHGVYRPDYTTRLFPKDKVFWEGVVHEHAVTELSTIRLKSPAYHYCLTNWEQYFAKFCQYTTLMAEKMQQAGKQTGFLGMHLHALVSFIQAYILKLGFLDGKLGFILCQYQYFYTLTKYVKLQRLRQEKGEKKG